MFVKRIKETCYSAISDNMGLKMLKKKHSFVSIEYTCYRIKLLNIPRPISYKAIN